MPDLLFEIWSDADEGISQMIMVHPQGDKIRLATTPNAVRVHSFTAHSDFEAFRQKNAWHGFDPWEDGGISEEHFFSEHEAVEQREYLAKRTISQPC